MIYRTFIAVVSIFALLITAPVLAAEPLARGKTPTDFGGEHVVILHYHRPAADYDGWNLWVWPEEGQGRAAAFSGFDDYGPYAVVALNERHDRLGFIVRRGEWDAKDIAQDRFISLESDGITEVWLRQDAVPVATDPDRLRYKPQTPPAAAGSRAATPDVTKLTRRAPASAKEVGASRVVVVHYHRPDGQYGEWNAWVWNEGAQGRAVKLDGRDEFGAFAVVRVDEPADKLGFILRKGDWNAREVGGDRWATFNAAGVAEVWVVADDTATYTDPKAIDFTPKVTAAFLDAPDLVKLRLSQAVQTEQLTADTASVTVGGAARAVARVRPTDLMLFGARQWELSLAQPISGDELAQSIAVHLPGFTEARVYARDVLTHDAFVADDAELGYRYAEDATTFRTWSPVAERVELLLYKDATGQPVRTVAMSRGDRVWEARVQGDLHGAVYGYRFHSYGEARTAADIHGYAATPDSKRSVVLDLRRTDPEGFRDPQRHQPPTVARATDEVIYEIHVRDFSIRDPNVPAAHRGKYLGLTNRNDAKTSLSHLKGLGVTTVHLLPIHDFGGAMEDYNWGYWTELFNVPEPRYATDPADPAAAIRELKQTIQALHDAGIRVVLDVVYNHTASSFANSAFDQAVPWHYFRTDDAGLLRNEAGVGNAIADERPMVRKYIVDSLVYWATEYQVDGFRFDLMGMHHPETVKAARDALRKVRPDVLIYGEPWTGGGPTHFPKGAQRGLNVAVFNDHIRNAVRGELDGPGLGFAMNGGNADALRKGIAGSIDDFTASPVETINYVEAHDNLTFWDKLHLALPHASESQKRAMQKLALGIVLTSQGVPFLHGGSEFCRTKGGNHNSYNAGDDVNAFDWARRDRYAEVVNYVAGLTTLRREHPAFRMSDAESVRANLKWISDQDVVAYTLNARAVGDAWGEILVAFNGHARPAEIDLPEGRWTVVVNHERAGTSKLGEARGKTTLPPHSMLVLVRE